MKRRVSVIQSFAERNTALRGSTDTLFRPNNDRFLKEELMAKSDPVLKQHIDRAENMTTYLIKTYKMN